MDVKPDMQTSTQPPSPLAKRRIGVHPYLLALAGVVLGGGSALLGYSVGHQQGMTAVGASADQVEKLRKTLQTQQASIDTLSQSMTVTTQERDLAVENNHQLTSQLATLTDAQQLAQARLEGLMGWVIRQGGAPLDLREVQIRPLPEQAFEYRVDLMAMPASGRPVNGTLSIYLIDGDTLLEVPVQPSRFSVQGFLRLTGRWTMPKGVTPQFIEVRVQGGAVPVVRRYAWEQGAVLTDLPATLADVPPPPTDPASQSASPAGQPAKTTAAPGPRPSSVPPSTKVQMHEQPPVP